MGNLTAADREKIQEEQIALLREETKDYSWEQMAALTQKEGLHAYREPQPPEGKKLTQRQKVTAQARAVAVSGLMSARFQAKHKAFDQVVAETSFADALAALDTLYKTSPHTQSIIAADHTEHEWPEAKVDDFLEQSALEHRLNELYNERMEVTKKTFLEKAMGMSSQEIDQRQDAILTKATFLAGAPHTIEGKLNPNRLQYVGTDTRRDAARGYPCGFCTFPSIELAGEYKALEEAKQLKMQEAEAQREVLRQENHRTLAAVGGKLADLDTLLAAKAEAGVETSRYAVTNLRRAIRAQHGYNPSISTFCALDESGKPCVKADALTTLVGVLGYGDYAKQGLGLLQELGMITPEQISAIPEESFKKPTPTKAPTKKKSSPAEGAEGFAEMASIVAPADRIQAILDGYDDDAPGEATGWARNPGRPGGRF